MGMCLRFMQHNSRQTRDHLHSLTTHEARNDTNAVTVIRLGHH